MYTQVVQVVHNIRSYYIGLCLNCNRPYAIDVITQITKHETDGGQKFGYYAALRRHFEWQKRPQSTEHKYSGALCEPFLTSAGFTPRMR